jgi:hypothetical protein
LERIEVGGMSEELTYPIWWGVTRLLGGWETLKSAREIAATYADYHHIPVIELPAGKSMLDVNVWADGPAVWIVQN